MLCCAVLGWVAWDSSPRCRQRACGSQWMPHPQTTSLHDRRGLVFDPRWPAVVLQFATLSGRLCELLSIASTVVTATKTSPRRTSRWKLLFLLPVFVFGFRLLPVDLNKQRLNTQHLNRHLNTDLNKQHLDTDLNKQHLSTDLDEQHLNQHLDERLNITAQG